MNLSLLKVALFVVSMRGCGEWSKFYNKFFNAIILVYAINCYNCEINEKYSLDTCNAFDDDTPEQNCPGQNYCMSAYGKFNGETDLEFHSCGEDYKFGLKGFYNILIIWLLVL